VSFFRPESLHAVTDCIYGARAGLAPRASDTTIRAVPRPRAISLVLALVALHALAREVDRALGLVLRAEVEPAGLLTEIARAMAIDPAAAAGRVAAWLAVALAVLCALAWRRARAHAAPFASTLEPEAKTLAPALAPLLLRPALTLVALVSLAIQPSYPYAFTLPVALTQDWGIAQDLLALAAILALRMPPVRLPAPRAGELLLLSFLGYAALVPQWAWHWDSHPGNEPKTLRQAVALGHWLSFDAAPVTGPMEELDTSLVARIPAAARKLGGESWRMLGALVRGEAGKDAIEPSRIARQVIRGKEGGVYSVLAPGPSLLIAPTLRVDRVLNRARGETGRVAVSVLLFCALAALLVLALFLLVRDATGRAGLAATLAFGFGLVPPFLFYFYQFYPEMLGALVLALAFRTLALRPERLAAHPARLGVLISTLPWLHQKFLPVWLVLAATALVVGWRVARRSPTGEPPPWNERAGRWHVARGVLAPTLGSAFAFALYNFAITGSVRPDALFLAWGPGGVSSARVGQGLLGLPLDARFGILPYVPLLILAAAGLVTGGARRFVAVLPAALAYYLTVASADNWSGAVCNLGRYAMPIAPLGVALVAMAIARVSGRRGAVTLVLALAGWTAVIALALRQDPHAANDSALLLAKSAYAEGERYVPGLFIRTWADAAPGLGARILAWLLLIGAVAFWFRRAAARGGEAGASPLRALAGVSAVLLVVALVLERAAPGARTEPSWPDAIALGGDTRVFLEGASIVREDEAVAGPGAVRVLVRSSEPLASLTVTVGGSSGFAHPAGRPPFPLRPTGATLDLPLAEYHVVRGRDGDAAFSSGYLWLDAEAVFRPSP